MITFTCKKESEEMKVFLDQEKLHVLYDEHKTDEEIAEITGYRKKSVAEWRYRNKLEMNGKKQAIKDNEFLELWNLGRTDKELAKIFNCAISSVLRYREINDLEPNGKIFDWQRELRPSELNRIPVKYWNPRFKRVS